MHSCSFLIAQTVILHLRIISYIHKNAVLPSLFVLSFKANILQFTPIAPILLLFLYKYIIMELNIFFKKILCRQLTIYQDTESYTINGTLSDTISDITDLILSFSA